MVSVVSGRQFLRVRDREAPGSKSRASVQFLNSEFAADDIGEADERAQNGVIKGAVHAPRGMIEFYADPTSPYHRPEFQLDRRIILQCASGGRSALATDTLTTLGYSRVAHLDGGFKAWKEQGLPIEQA